MNFLPLLLSLILSLSLSPKSVQADSIKVVTYNVWYGFTKKKERKPAYLEYVRSLKADIVALQELNGYTEEGLAEDAKFWGHSYSAILKIDGFPTGITSRYPLTENTEGNRRLSPWYAFL